MTKPQIPFGRDEIMTCLPHRDPMLMLDRVTDLSDGVITAELDIAADLPCFEGHFPGNPVFPGVLMIEAMAQAGALLVDLETGLEQGHFLAFSGVETAKFRRPVRPGDVLIVRSEVTKQRGPMYKFKATCHVGDVLVAQCAYGASQMAAPDTSTPKTEA